MSLQARQESVIDMPYVKVLFWIPVLPAAFQVTFQHETHDGAPALLELFQDVAGHFNLALMVLPELSCEQSTITPRANPSLATAASARAMSPTL